MAPLPTHKLPYFDYVELAINVFALFVSAYFLFLLRRPVFHLNLRILLAKFTLDLTGITISRSVLLTYVLITNGPPPFWLQVVHDAFVRGFMTGSVLMAGERAIATIYVEIYERVTGSTVTAAVCLFTFGLDFLISYLTISWRDDITYYDEKSGFFVFGNPEHRTNLAIAESTFLVLNVVGFLMFVFIYRYNKKRWTIDLSKKLGHRYQISENIRTTKQLFMVLIGDLVICVYFNMVIFYIFIIQRSDFYANASAQILDLGMAMATAVMPMLFILTSPKLREHSILRYFRREIGNEVWSGRSMTNKPLVFSVGTQGTVYFKQLAKSWDAYRPSNDRA